jgi:hypothetical protein
MGQGRSVFLLRSRVLSHPATQRWISSPASSSKHSWLAQASAGFVWSRASWPSGGDSGRALRRTYSARRNYWGCSARSGSYRGGFFQASDLSEGARCGVVQPAQGTTSRRPAWPSRSRQAASSMVAIRFMALNSSWSRQAGYCYCSVSLSVRRRAELSRFRVLSPKCERPWQLTSRSWYCSSRCCLPHADEVPYTGPLLYSCASRDALCDCFLNPIDEGTVERTLRLRLP